MNFPVVSPPTATDPQLHGQAWQETLELLEWSLVCQHLSDFASTRMGRDAARQLPLPSHVSASRQRLAETMELVVLDDLCEGGLSFRGAVDLRPVAAALQQRWCRFGEELLGVAETLAAARRLRRQIAEPEVRPVTTALVEAMVTLPDLEQRLKFSSRRAAGSRIAPALPWPACGSSGMGCGRSVATSFRSCSGGWARHCRTR